MKNIRRAPEKHPSSDAEFSQPFATVSGFKFLLSPKFFGDFFLFSLPDRFLFHYSPGLFIFPLFYGFMPECSLLGSFKSVRGTVFPGLLDGNPHPGSRLRQSIRFLQNVHEPQGKLALTRFSPDIDPDIEQKDDEYPEGEKIGRGDNDQNTVQVFLH